MSYPPIVAAMFSAGGKMTVEIEVHARADCAAALDGTRLAVESIGPVSAIVGQFRIVA